MRRTAGVSAVIVSVVTVVGAQFEVASVKRSTSNTPGFTMLPEPGRFSATNVPLRFIIMAAFRAPDWGLDGGPGWINTDRYDIQAKEPDGAPPQQWPERLRALLVERFQLATHTEQRSMQGFALMLARNDGRLGERLRRTDACEKAPSLPPCGQGRGSDHSYQMNGLTMSMLASVLRQRVGGPVEDRTGLAGNFVAELDWALERRPGSPDAVPDDGVALVTALQEQLGLRLQRERVNVDVVVIDRVERPAEN
jgi:uncharacterized protein (TIGR03435 family)